MSLLEIQTQALLTAAEAGNAQAQYDLGRIFLEAAQSQADIDRAVTWLHRAVQRNHPDALFELAKLYLMGKAGKSDSDPLNRALRWLLCAKELGHPQAGKFFKAIMVTLQANHAGEYDSEYDELFADEEYSEENDEAGEVHDAEGAGRPAWSNREASEAEDSDEVSDVSEGDSLIIDDKMLSNHQSLQTLADMGVTQAMAILGDFYLQGKDGPKDEQKGWEWLQKAAAQDDPFALFRLGCICMQGLSSLPQDFSQARYYLFRAVALGNNEALLTLGEWYSHEQNEAKDYRKAAQNFEKALEAGILPAFARLAELYAQGLGVPQDDTKALELYTQGARRGDCASQYGLALAYLYGKGTQSDPTRALKWLRKAAASGSAPAQIIIDRYDGKGQAATSDSAPAQGQMPKLKPLGLSVEPQATVKASTCNSDDSGIKSATPSPPAPPDLASFVAMGQALSVLRTRQRTAPDPVLKLRVKHAEKNGEDIAACHMGVICEKTRDWESARRWYAQAARGGQALGLYNLGVLWETGRGGECNLQQAFSCYNQAAQQGYAKAQYNLCLLYARGQGTTRSLEQAMSWCTQAADQGLPEAQRLLETFRKYAY